MERIFGDAIEYNNTEELYEFIEKMNPEDGLLLLESALLYAGAQGIFSMVECYAVFSAISKLKFKHSNNENQDSRLHHNDSNGDINQ